MFDLEKSIAEWQQQMLAAGIKTPAPLEELESHLRQEIQQQMGLGVSERRAFEISVQYIGQPKNLKNEFNKEERNLMKKPLVTLIGIFLIFFGTIMILPALGRHYHQGKPWNPDICEPLIIGIVITLAGVGTAIAGLKKRKA